MRVRRRMRRGRIHGVELGAGGLIFVILARAGATTACCAALLGRAQRRRQLGDKPIDIAGNIAADTLEKATSVFMGECAIAELEHSWNCQAHRAAVATERRTPRVALPGQGVPYLRRNCERHFSIAENVRTLVDFLDINRLVASGHQVGALPRLASAVQENAPETRLLGLYGVHDALANSGLAQHLDVAHAIKIRESGEKRIAQARDIQLGQATIFQKIRIVIRQIIDFCVWLHCLSFS